MPNIQEGVPNSGPHEFQATGRRDSRDQSSTSMLPRVGRKADDASTQRLMRDTTPRVLESNWGRGTREGVCVIDVRCKFCSVQNLTVELFVDKGCADKSNIRWLTRAIGTTRSVSQYDSGQAAGGVQPFHL